MKQYLTKTNVILCLFLLGLMWFVGSIKAILLPFVLAFVLAYILHPIVEKITSKHVGRGCATGVVVLSFCLFVVGIFLILIPLLQAQVLDFMRRIPQYSATVWNAIKNLMAYTKDTISKDQLAEISDAVNGSVMSVLTAIGVSLSHVLTSGIAVFNILALILITPVVLFYVLKDWNVIREKIAGLIPKNKEKQTLSLSWLEIIDIFAGDFDIFASAGF